MIRKKTQPLVLFLALQLFMGYSQLAYSQAADPKQDKYLLKPEEFESRIDKKNAVILDVRTPEEYATGHYDGAVNIPLDEIEARINEFGPKDGPIIVYCRSGRRAEEAKTKLEANGFTHVISGGGLADMPLLL